MQGNLTLTDHNRSKEVLSMSKRVAIIYNEPILGKYQALGESAAVDGVNDAVTGVNKALDELNYEVITVPLKPPLSLVETMLRELHVDVVFNLFEGFENFPGSESAVASLLNINGLCFTGSQGDTLLMCENKEAAKYVLRSYGIPTPNWQVISFKGKNDFCLEFPCIVKPMGEHASHGISEKSVVRNIRRLKQQVVFIWEEYERPSLVEEFLTGREFRALVIGNECHRILPIEEIIYDLPPNKPRLMTYAAKWLPGSEYFLGTQERCPAEVKPSLQNAIETIALQSFTALNCRGYASIDMREDKNGQLMVIDVNPNTDVSPMGGAKYPIEASGVDYTTFIGEILNLATHTSKEREQETWMWSTIKSV
jgi:D-alanine-D-alanine ligase